MLFYSFHFRGHAFVVNNEDTFLAPHCAHPLHTKAHSLSASTSAYDEEERGVAACREASSELNETKRIQ